MTSELSWADYVRSLSDNQSEIAQRTGTAQSTVSRWISGQVIPDARTVIAVARAYKLSPVAALVTAGYLTPEELGDAHAMPKVWAIRQFTDLELAVETLRRVDRGSEVLEAPLDGEHPAMTGKLSQLPTNVGGFVDDALHGLDTAAGTDETQAEDD